MIGTLIAGVVSSIGCKQTTRVALCKERLPQFRALVVNARLALAPSLSAPGRMLASEPSDGDKSETEFKTDAQPVAEFDTLLGEADRLAWAKWSEDRLAEAQDTLEWAITAEGLGRERPAIKSAINDLANRFVELGAYAQRGDGNRMLETLQSIEIKADKLDNVMCSTASL